MDKTNVLINNSESNGYCIKFFLSVNVDVSLKLPSIFDSFKNGRSQNQIYKSNYVIFPF